MTLVTFMPRRIRLCILSGNVNKIPENADYYFDDKVLHKFLRQKKLEKKHKYFLFYCFSNFLKKKFYNTIRLNYHTTSLLLLNKAVILHSLLWIKTPNSHLSITLWSQICYSCAYLTMINKQSRQISLFWIVLSAKAHNINRFIFTNKNLIILIIIIYSKSKKTFYSSFPID